MDFHKTWPKRLLSSLPFSLGSSASRHNDVNGTAAEQTQDKNNAHKSESGKESAPPPATEIVIVNNQQNTDITEVTTDANIVSPTVTHMGGTATVYTVSNDGDNPSSLAETETETETDKSNDAWVMEQLKKSLEFVAISEESKSTPMAFCKIYSSPRLSATTTARKNKDDQASGSHKVDDWRDNHFLSKDRGQKQARTKNKNGAGQPAKKNAKKKKTSTKAKDVESENEDAAEETEDEKEGELQGQNDEYNSKVEDNNRIILHSYEVDLMRKKFGDDIIAVNDGNIKVPPSPGSLPYWIKLADLDLSCSKPPEIPKEEGSKVAEILKNFQQRNPSLFAECGDDLYAVLSQLTLANIPPKDQMDSATWTFFSSYFKWAGAQERRALDQALFDLVELDSNSESSELVMLIGHARKLFMCPKDHKQKIVNGPLLEVPIEIVLEEAEDGAEVITVRPRNGSQIALNIEVVSALGGNANVINKLAALAEQTKTESLFPGNPDTYCHFVKAARRSAFTVEYRSCHYDPAVIHEPPRDSNALVLTNAWCLHLRPKSSTVYSRDARALLQALNTGKMKITPALRMLVEGVDSSDELASSSGEGADELVYALPASSAQRQIGEDVFVRKQPITIVHGPPGTGKTHSIVNIAAAALMDGMSVLFTSMNPGALTAFVDKLPPELRALCLDMPSCGMVGLHKALEEMQLSLNDVKKREQEYATEIKSLTEQITTKKVEKKSIDQKLQSASKLNRRLIKTGIAARIVNVVLNSGETMPWAAKSAVVIKDFAFLDQIDELLLPEVAVPGKAVSFDDVEVSEKLRTLVCKKIQEAGNEAGTPRLLSGFSGCSEHEELGKIKVDGTSPSSPDDWEDVVKIIDITLRCRRFEQAIASLLQFGCCDKDIYEPGTRSIRKQFVQELKKGKVLQGLLSELMTEEEDRKSMETMVLSPGCKELQARLRQLTVEIQHLERQLVFRSTIVAISKSLKQEHRRELVALTEIVGKTNNKTLSSTGARALRLTREFKEKFAEVINFMPFVVMTAKQASLLLAPDQHFDLGIFDETSQSDCTALTIVARCNQVLAVGDDKQVSPSTAFLSEERINALKERLPKIPPAKGLLPEGSFFYCLKLACPTNSIFLNEHFRCNPGIIKVSNALFYCNGLDPLRLPTNKQVLFDVRVKGKRVNKRNQAECNMILQIVANKIEYTAINTLQPKTIIIISMGGDEQVSLIKKCLEVKLDSLRIEYGSTIVKQHNIRVGTPSEVQGDERDIAIISAGYGGTESGFRLHPEDILSDPKKWNVALTRGKEEVYLIRSYDMKHTTNSDDTRRKVLEHFNNEDQKQASASAQTSFKAANKVEDKLVSSLLSSGFNVSRKGGKVWGKALLVRLTGHTNAKGALILIENADESEEAYLKFIDEHLSLERAGIACLRVPYLSLALNFHDLLKDVLDFLEEEGLSPDTLQRDCGNGAQSMPNPSVADAPGSEPSSVDRKPPAVASATKRKEPSTTSPGGPPTKKQVQSARETTIAAAAPADAADATHDEGNEIPPVPASTTPGLPNTDAETFKLKPPPVAVAGKVGAVKRSNPPDKDRSEKKQKLKPAPDIGESDNDLAVLAKEKLATNGQVDSLNMKEIRAIMCTYFKRKGLTKKKKEELVELLEGEMQNNQTVLDIELASTSSAATAAPSS